MKPVKLARLKEFWKFLEKFRTIERKIHTASGDRLENDSEHTFNLALLAWFVSADRDDLNTNKVLKLALVHDLIEVYAGDAAFFETNKMQQKRRLEKQAVETLSQEWADFKDLKSLVKEYEDRQTTEAKFVYALDKIAPLLNNYLTGAVSWQQFKIPYETVKSHKAEKVALDPQVLAIYKELIAYFDAHPELHYKG